MTVLVCRFIFVFTSFCQNYFFVFNENDLTLKEISTFPGNGILGEDISPNKILYAVNEMPCIRKEKLLCTYVVTLKTHNEIMNNYREELLKCWAYNPFDLS